MSSVTTPVIDPSTDYYLYLCDTLDASRRLTDRLVFMEDYALSSQANQIRQALSSQLDSLIQSQITALGDAEFSG